MKTILLIISLSLSMLKVNAQKEGQYIALKIDSIAKANDVTLAYLFHGAGLLDDKGNDKLVIEAPFLIWHDCYYNLNQIKRFQIVERKRKKEKIMYFYFN